MPRLPRASLKSRRLQTRLLSGLVLLQALLAVSQAAVTSAVTGDGTLGTTVTQSGTIYDIMGGTRPGNGPNLFHSFDRFSVGTGDTARFSSSGQPGVVNILSRVTGGQPSTIDGGLRSEIAGANLYLLNPAGVMFGPHASLDVRGSFHVSTGDYLRFTDGAKFSANLGQESVLTVAPPAAFGFLGNSPAPITIQGSALQVPAGKALSIVGGDITLMGGPLWVEGVPALDAAGGRIYLASVASPGEVGFSPLELASDLQVEGFARLGEVELHRTGLISGNIVLWAGRLTLTDGAQISSDAHNVGPAGDVTITATDAILLSGHSMTFPFGPSSPIPRVSQISSRFIGQGPGGWVVISTPSLRMDEGLILADSSGRGGDIELRVGRLTLSGGAQIGSNTFAGQGGNVLITATESATISGHSHTAEIPANASGRDGRAPSGVFSQTTELGNGGRVSITTPRLIMAEGSRIAVDTGGDGSGGNIHVQVGALSVASGAQITSSSGFTQRLVFHVGTGQGGNITITAVDVVSIAGQNSGLFSETNGPGRGGNLTLHGRELRLTEGARISATSSGTGDAGNLQLAATEVSLRDHSTITTAAAQSSGGNIELRAGSRVRLRDSTLTTSVRGGAETVGGNLTIGAPLVIVGSSQILATAVEGQGGNIDIGAEVLLADSASLIDASSAVGLSGTVDIQAPVTSLSGTLAPLPQTFVNVAALLPARCAARFSGGKASSIVVGGRPGLPVDPSGVLPSPLALEERLVADPAVTGEPYRQKSAARFAFLEDQEKALPRLPRDQGTGRCPP
jgi:filamentous hemagglutinin family protein